jgi:hypothetical protein
MKIKCSVCGRVRANNEPTDAEEKISHGLCPKCLLADDDTRSFPIEYLYDPAQENNQSVINFKEQLKDGIRDEIIDSIQWEGPAEYSDLVNSLYDRFVREAKSELRKETEMGSNAKR